MSRCGAMWSPLFVLPAIHPWRCAPSPPRPLGQGKIPGRQAGLRERRSSSDPRPLGQGKQPSNRVPADASVLQAVLPRPLGQGKTPAVRHARAAVLPGRYTPPARAGSKRAAGTQAALRHSARRARGTLARTMRGMRFSARCAPCPGRALCPDVSDSRITHRVTDPQPRRLATRCGPSRG